MKYALLGVLFFLLLPTIIEEKLVYISETRPTEVKGIELDTASKEEIINLLTEESLKRGLDPRHVIKIAQCESQLNPKAYNAQTKDFGLLQVNHTHIPEMNRRGLNIKSSQDTLTFGLDLMKSEGDVPWYASRHCWSL